MQVKELHQKSKNYLPPEKMEELIKKMRKEDEKPVKGMFEFLDAKGGWFDFSYRKYREPIKTYRIYHGEICELPLGIVKHLNNTQAKTRNFGTAVGGGQIPQGTLLDGRGGVPSTYQTWSRVRFIPMDMM